MTQWPLTADKGTNYQWPNDQMANDQCRLLHDPLLLLEVDAGMCWFCKVISRLISSFVFYFVSLLGAPIIAYCYQFWIFVHYISSEPFQFLCCFPHPSFTTATATADATAGADAGIAALASDAAAAAVWLLVSWLFGKARNGHWWCGPLGTKAIKNNVQLLFPTS